MAGMSEGRMRVLKDYPQMTQMAADKTWLSADYAD
jgi:hypothetical protein